MTRVGGRIVVLATERGRDLRDADQTTTSALGAQKIREVYLRQYGQAPSESSFKRVLERCGLTQKRKVRPARADGTDCERTQGERTLTSATLLLSAINGAFCK